jgi:hypothetical protein
MHFQVMVEENASQLLYRTLLTITAKADLESGRSRGDLFIRRIRRTDSLSVSFFSKRA